MANLRSIFLRDEGSMPPALDKAGIILGAGFLAWFVLTSVMWLVGRGM